MYRDQSFWAQTCSQLVCGLLSLVPPVMLKASPIYLRTNYSCRSLAYFSTAKEYRSFSWRWEEASLEGCCLGARNVLNWLREWIGLRPRVCGLYLWSPSLKGSVPETHTERKRDWPACHLVSAWWHWEREREREKGEREKGKKAWENYLCWGGKLLFLRIVQLCLTLLKMPWLISPDTIACLTSTSQLFWGRFCMRCSFSAPTQKEKLFTCTDWKSQNWNVSGRRYKGHRTRQRGGNSSSRPSSRILQFLWSSYNQNSCSLTKVIAPTLFAAD